MHYSAILPSYIRYNETISARTKVLYAEITAVADEKGIAKIDDIQHKKIGIESKNTVKTALRKLSKLGYIQLDGEKIRLYSAFETTITVVENDKKKKTQADHVDITKIINLWNTLYETSYPQNDPQIRGAIYGRLSSFSREQIEQAIENRFKDTQTNPWYRENSGYVPNIWLVIRDDNSLMKFLHLKPKEIALDMSKTTVKIKENKNLNSEILE